MASIAFYTNGEKRLHVKVDGKLRSVHLPRRMTRKQANEVRAFVDELALAKALGRVPDDATVRWLAGLDVKMRRKLETAGLAGRSATRTDWTLGQLFTEWFASLTIKPGTMRTYQQTRDSMIAFFGENKPLRDINKLDCDKWRQHMKSEGKRAKTAECEGEGLADATISKRVKTARQAFIAAVDWEMVAKNPLKKVKAGAQTNRDRMHFIDRATAQKVLDACPNAEWRLIFALSRYGGLRCPSEHLALKWGDVDWEHNRLTITSSKTEHYAGKESRVLPLFPELEPYLRDVFDNLPEGAPLHVITRYRDNSKNLRTQLKRIIRRAGVAPWPKTFHNLRSTRQTELEERFPSHVVCQWLGNSEKIARGHYLQVTDAHFDAAAKQPDGTPAQKPAQHTATYANTGAQKAGAENAKGPEIPSLVASCDYLTNCQVTPTGFEPVSRP